MGSGGGCRSQTASLLRVLEISARYPVHSGVRGPCNGLGAIPPCRRRSRAGSTSPSGWARSGRWPETRSLSRAAHRDRAEREPPSDASHPGSGRGSSRRVAGLLESSRARRVRDRVARNAGCLRRGGGYAACRIRRSRSRRRSATRHGTPASSAANHRYCQGWRLGRSSGTRDRPNGPPISFDRR